MILGLSIDSLFYTYYYTEEFDLELLSPVSNIESLTAAINAGADAVYAGSDRFSARASADNMTVEELCGAIRTAHLRGVRVYLTLNTLINEKEFIPALDMIRPLYESGLDGIIIQDLGLIEAIKELYPELPLHASTQMGIMNSEGALRLKESGISRIVPARELSLKELKEIKTFADIELECFIHGAMCYSYSGYCLMSSCLGGRSGNRGRCAGTCRLPYTVPEYSSSQSQKYPLSMKDLCALPILPKLIEAGIDSFKIEGRMKSPEYVAGVTVIYRKYIDMYMTDPENYHVDEADTDMLKGLYIRTELFTGYFDQPGKHKLVTFDKPGYNGTDDDTLIDLRAKYITEPRRIPVDMRVLLRTGRPSCLEITGNGISCICEGPAPEEAVNSPISSDEIKKRLGKLGNTGFTVDNITVEADENIFMSVSQLNELRRSAIKKLEDSIITDIHGLTAGRLTVKPAESGVNSTLNKQKASSKISFKTDIAVSSLEQLSAIIDSTVKPHRIFADYRLFTESKGSLEDALKGLDIPVYMSFPIICRNKHMELFMGLIGECEKSEHISGVFVHSFDELCVVSRYLENMPVVTDTHVYAFNSRSLEFLSSFGNLEGCVLPYELGINDLKDIRVMSSCSQQLSMVTYGHIPVMISEGCLNATYGRCVRYGLKPGETNTLMLRDRLKKDFPVSIQCDMCINVIYNTVPLNLINYRDEIIKYTDRQVLYLTNEDYKTSSLIFSAFLSDDPADIKRLSERAHTTGHIKRGVI